MAASRTLVTVSWSLQRIRHGEQAPWMGLTLAAMLGEIGLPGGGFGHGYGSMNEPGLPPVRCRLPSLPQGLNPVQTFIPVAAVSDMLLHPGEPFDYNRLRLTYPDIKLVYWAGGNPFHHHQNIPRLRRALGRVDTVVVHDPYWTAMAKHADIVVPSTTAFERDDYSGSRNDPLLVAMPALTPPYAQSRDDYTTFAALADRLGFGPQFTEGRTAWQWLAHMYDKWAAGLDFDVPSFDEFWRQGGLRLPTDPGLTLLADFRADPQAHRLATPSGLIEIFSDDIDGFGYDDCAGHPKWYEPSEWLGGPRAARYPLHLLANQPASRLHGQLDGGAISQRSKVHGREPIRMHSTDAAACRLVDGDVVRVFNGRGACLAGVVVDERLRPYVVQLSTGAWFDPADPADPHAMCVHGNPNVLTEDVGTSSLARGCTGAHVLCRSRSSPSRCRRCERMGRPSSCRGNSARGQGIWLAGAGVVGRLYRRRRGLARVCVLAVDGLDARSATKSRRQADRFHRWRCGFRRYDRDRGRGVLAATGWLGPVRYLDFTALRIIGTALAVTGIGMVGVAQSGLGSSWRPTVDYTERTELVRTGLFAVVRNPIFTFIIVTAACMALMTPNVVALAGVVALWLGIELHVRRVEKPYLRWAHGDAYRDYTARVGRFLPRIGQTRL